MEKDYFSPILTVNLIELSQTIAGSFGEQGDAGSAMSIDEENEYSL